MSSFYYPTNVTADVPDSRDYLYTPTLSVIPAEKPPERNLNIRDQGKEGSCTGFATCSAIDYLNQKRNVDIQVSPRMLYEMAKKNDEWPGEEYDGSSLRGAIKGWKNMGVCSEAAWPYKVGRKKEYLTIAAAEEARKNTVGAYYRLLPEISHFHNVINEAGVVIASAHVHKGWAKPVKGVIKPSTEPISSDEKDAGHAFAIVGYNKDGFYIQNSWGKKWGDGGVAVWTYEDWIDNIIDSWVVSLGLPTPTIFGKETRNYQGFTREEDQSTRISRTVDRSEIAGHFIHIDDGKYHDKGKYWSNPDDVEQTAKLVGQSDQYDHLVFYFHGGLNSPKASAHRVRSMKEGFKRNGIYPYHVMYDTGLAEELKDLIVRKGKETFDRIWGISDYTDRYLEGLLKKPGTLIWDEMKRDAEMAFASQSAGLDAVNRFSKHLRASSGRPKKIHLVGHSTGAIVIAHLLRRLQNRTSIEIASCSLMAPAATLDLFDSHIGPVYQERRRLKLKNLNIYNLRDHLEKDDNVAKVYQKSLLYLVSNSFEKNGRATPILGMEKFKDDFEDSYGKSVIKYSNGRSGTVTRSKNHVEFDNDVYTMNHVLKTILGKTPAKPFEFSELNPGS